MIKGQNLRATIMIMAAAVLWGLIGPFSIWGAREGLTATQTAFWRTALAFLPFAWLARRQGTSHGRAGFVGAALFGVLGIAVMYVAYFVAVQEAGPGIAAVLLYTGPAWVALFQWTSEKRLPGHTSLVALVLTIIGVVLVSYFGAAESHLNRVGIAAGLLSGVSFATHFIFGRRLFANHGAPFVFAVAMLAAALVIAPIARPTLPSAGAIPPLIFLSFIATFASSLLFSRGVVAVTPVRAAITATIEPVVAMTVSILVLGSVLHWPQLIGAAFVLTGVTLIIVQDAPAET